VKAIHSLLIAALLTFATPLFAAEDEERSADLFAHWRASQGPQLEAFEAYLVRQRVAQVVPVYQLLRTASMWKECRAQPFQVPPPQLWPKVADVLKLLQELRNRGVLTAFEVVSAYRDPQLNRCAGGAPRSAHVLFAVDLRPVEPDAGARLCRFWREQGRPWNMGLSRYPSGRVHIDRNGYRTWGASHGRGSSFCLK
jgi:hypothetical protein